MSAAQLRIAGAGLLFFFIFIFGFWLSRSGKPYNVMIFTIHKLIALGAIVFLAQTVYKFSRQIPSARHKFLSSRLRPCALWQP